MGLVQAHAIQPDPADADPSGTEAFHDQTPYRT